MDRRPYYLQKAEETAALADRFSGPTRDSLLGAVRAWRVLLEVEEERLSSPLLIGLDDSPRLSRIDLADDTEARPSASRDLRLARRVRV